MKIESEVLAILNEVLGLKGRTEEFDAETALLGVIPEFDSMAVVGVLTTIEERFDIVIEDDDIDASAFETIGTLVSFVEQRL